MLYYIDVSKKRGTPKWMVYNRKPYEQMDDLEVPLFSETPKKTPLQLAHSSLLKRGAIGLSRI